MSADLLDIPLHRIDGAPAKLADYRGKVLLVVNVASKCGLTPQYEGLEALYKARHKDGLEILGFPANNFGAQEPGTEAEIVEFCTTNYGVSFPMFSKISVGGEDKHPLYQALTKAKPEAQGDPGFRERLKGYGITPSAEGEVLWNFEKFLIGRDGRVLARFMPDMPVNDPRILAAIDAALAS